MGSFAESEVIEGEWGGGWVSNVGQMLYAAVSAKAPAVH